MQQVEKRGRVLKQKQIGFRTCVTSNSRRENDCREGAWCNPHTAEL
jgi:hypothetical protein